jgi:hypothetical protein
MRSRADAKMCSHLQTRFSSSSLSNTITASGADPESLRDVALAGFARRLRFLDIAVSGELAGRGDGRLHVVKPGLLRSGPWLTQNT